MLLVRGQARLMGPLSLRHNVSWTFAGNAIYAACGWGMLAVLAKLGSPEMVGILGLALAVTTPVIMFTNLQLRGIQATDATRQYRFNDYLALRLATTGLALLLIGGFVFGAGYGGETALVILAVAVAKGLDAIGDVCHGLCQQRERLDLSARGLMLNGLLSVTVLTVAVSLTGSVVWGAVGSALASAVTLACYDFPITATLVRSGLRPSGAIRPLLRLAWLALPLGAVMLLVSLNAYLPRYFIEGNLGHRELGLFTALASLMIAGTSAVNALGQSASPRLARFYAAGDVEAFRALLLKLLGLGAAGGLLGIALAAVAGEQIVTLLFTADYAGHANVLLLLAAAAGIGFMASFLGYAMIAARAFRVQAPLFGGVVILGVVACAVLIPRYGLTGGAAAALLSACCQLGGSALVVRRCLQQGGSAS